MIGKAGPKKFGKKGWSEGESMFRSPMFPVTPNVSMRGFSYPGGPWLLFLLCFRSIFSLKKPGGIQRAQLRAGPVE